LLAIQKALDENVSAYKMNLPAEDGALLAWCYRRGVVSAREETDAGTLLTLNLSDAQYDYVRGFVELDSIVKIS
jgi:50S ribosomal subunit-associated GTPase HflX